MKAWILGIAALLAASLAWADATVTSVSGTVTAQAGSAAARPVRQGDRLRSGEIVATAGTSSVVMRFDDEQIVALGQNTRMEIQRYDYNAQAKTGNVALRLLRGAMRAITGVIGRTKPDNVTYRAGNYTIGIRGTDVTLVYEGEQAVVTVEDGFISFSYGGKTVTVRAGEGVSARGAEFRQGAINTILDFLRSTPAGQSFLDAIGGVNALSLAVGQAASGQTGTITTPGPGSSGTGGGGGTASKK